jgi:hypothetical protein
MSESEPTPTDEIERLEAEIDELRDSIQRSRRLVMVGRLCALAGAALLVALIVGLTFFTPMRMIIGISLGLGGLVLMGSSVGSTTQLEHSLKQAEGDRNAAIDALKLVQLGEGGR